MKPSVWDTTFTDSTSVAPTGYEPKPTSKPSRAEPSAHLAQRNDERYDDSEGGLKWQNHQAHRPVQRLDERYENDYTTSNEPAYRRYDRPSYKREPLQGKKTYLWAASYALAGVAILLGFEIPEVHLSSADAMGMIWEAGSFVFVRLGISKIFKSNN